MKYSTTDLIGKKSGRLTVTSFSHAVDATTYWNCICECGEKVKVRRTNIVSRRTKSCGCLVSETSVVNGFKATHGKSRTKIYFTWQSMKQRCYDKKTENYKYYGAKNVSICNEWLEFEKFNSWAMNNGYQENLTIDRINTDGNYNPSNCRWTTQKVQNRNKRVNHCITLNNKTKCLGEWSELLNIPMSTLVNRCNRTNDPIEILNTNYKRKCKRFGNRYNVNRGSR